MNYFIKYLLKPSRYNAHPNTIHASFQGSNNASYQSNSLWSLNDHSDNNPSNFNTISSNNNDNAFSMNNVRIFLRNTS